MPTLDERQTAECSYRLLVSLVESVSDVWIGHFAKIACEQAECSLPGRDVQRAAQRSVSATVSPEQTTRALHVGEAVRVEWETRGYSSVFPSFTGQLRVRRIDERLSELRVTGEYVRPRGSDASAFAARALLSHLRATVEELAGDRVRAPLGRLAPARYDWSAAGTA